MYVCWRQRFSEVDAVARDLQIIGSCKYVNCSVVRQGRHTCFRRATHVGPPVLVAIWSLFFFTISKFSKRASIRAKRSSMSLVFCKVFGSWNGPSASAEEMSGNAGSGKKRVAKNELTLR
ncbi:hypothetical protein B0H12DRAFT_786627 [Mycena haematopus]|nr:hypothetical protein B0H12DRAFT_786627 [Mycena haematopus]